MAGIFFRFACANSYDDCISNQKLGCVPSAADRRFDISADTKLAGLVIRKLNCSHCDRLPHLLIKTTE